jgi:thiol-disulfide isomerase/thioredoxin
MPEPFENVKNQIGFCGIWCGSCRGGNGTVIELAKMFKGLIQRDAVERYAPKFDFDEFMKGLSSMSAIYSCPGCQKGGGIPDCKIRICARM